MVVGSVAAMAAAGLDGLSVVIVFVRGLEVCLCRVCVGDCADVVRWY